MINQNNTSLNTQQRFSNPQRTKKELIELCDNIHMPEPVVQSITGMPDVFDSKIVFDFKKLTEKSHWRQGLDFFKNSLGNDPFGLKILTCTLIAALETKKRYQELGISDHIFYATMECFSRFVKEHKASYGCYGFDREWWVTRQLSGLVFRLGTLEFEMNSDLEESCLKLHIPSDADISHEKCTASYSQAYEFFRTYFPEFHFRNITCSSWLLSPNLKQVLKENSKIIQFQNTFHIQEFNPENREFIAWIFKNDKLEVSEYPEQTSLQKNVKKYLLEGNSIGSASGLLIFDAT